MSIEKNMALYYEYLFDNQFSPLPPPTLIWLDHLAIAQFLDPEHPSNYRRMCKDNQACKVTTMYTSHTVL